MLKKGGFENSSVLQKPSSGVTEAFVSKKYKQFSVFFVTLWLNTFYVVFCFFINSSTKVIFLFPKSLFHLRQIKLKDLQVQVKKNQNWKRKMSFLHLSTYHFQIAAV